MRTKPIKTNQNSVTKLTSLLGIIIPTNLLTGFQALRQTHLQGRQYPASFFNLIINQEENFKSKKKKKIMNGSVSMLRNYNKSN